MQLLARTAKGLEEQAVEELEEITEGEGKKVEEGLVLLEGNEKSVFRANYLSKTCSRFIDLIDSFQVQEVEDIHDKIEAEFSKYLKEDQTFVVKVNREGKHDFSSPDAARKAGQAVVDQYEKETGKKPSVDLDKPDITFRLELRGEKAYFGIDTTGKTLDRRKYLQLEEPEIYPVLANCIVRRSGWEEGFSLLDPFSVNGTIPIEAGIIANRTPNAGRKFSFMEIPKYDLQKYKQVAQEAKERMEKKDLDLEGSYQELNSADIHGKEAGVSARFSEEHPLERPLESDFIVFKAPYIEQKSKRRKIREAMLDFEKRLVDERFEKAVAFTQRKEFFENYDNLREVEYRDMKGFLVEWNG
ncbi:MAG: THUMP domain-containing protein [Candidatus Nanohaloarchaeota archaeon QJJ-9]|nr:THUMP domain-containing protein [Candidatus Nanohaloarchaeota archaeon QJJ-9]